MLVWANPRGGEVKNGWEAKYWLENGKPATNVLEYALGLNPRTSSQPPGTFNGSVLSFTKGEDARINQDIDYIIEESDDLGLNDGWEAVQTQYAPNNTTAISHTLPNDTPKVFARLKVKQATSNPN